MRGLAGKRTIITGAGQGNGAAIARRFAEEGCRLLLMDLRAHPLQEVAAELAGQGVQVHTVTGDVSQQSDVDRVAGSARALWGEVDLLINNAGIALPGHLFDVTREMWDRTIAVNLTGTFLMSQTIGRLIAAAGGGAIVHMSSTNGIVAEPDHAPYNASKGGVTLLTKTMALDLARHNIRVNAVCPGLIRTPLTVGLSSEEFLQEYVAKYVPMGRIGTPEEVAAAFAFLASDDASFITGATLVIDGGQLAL
jgi:3-oxoacyl-[acyl-carrier protein] reductase